MTIDSKRAGYWYNPNQGIVRARVPVGISDDRALRLYNRINGTALTSIYSKEALPKPSEAPKPDATKVAATPEGTPVATAAVPETTPREGVTESPAEEPPPAPPTGTPPP
jgi:hypothetical protein